ncbi:hypothetical protein P43SY_002576 [Pythium insidiosum]|uniref:Zinc (Zn2)-Iron (Fe2) Permease (ZIP) Family n=1 Tax=Pythium insidiosum TaxID=114742 RepID=A0AAD5QF32_PYTIN|nr:hypothetical protein P43SY_002576 [Pythium insidiosum]
MLKQPPRARRWLSAAAFLALVAVFASSLVADHAHSHDHSHQANSGDQRKIDRFSPAIWAEALFATALVGAAPVVVLLFVPLGIGSQESQKPLLRVFLSFAAGGLLGDALLHLLPHSMPHGHSQDHAHDHAHGHEGHSHSVQDLAVWLWTIAGMMTFLMLEKFVRAQTGGGHSHGHGHAHGHGHSHGGDKTSHSERVEKSSNQRDDSLRKRPAAKLKTDQADPDSSANAKLDDSPSTHKSIAAAGYLNLAADFTHNFTDGLAIGATFLRGSGWQTTLAMLLHELPHEIGDFAILIQSGFTRREAMLTQFVTAVGAMIGTVLGLLIEGAGDSSSAWISPFTAGGFIYIACASVMPELLEDCSLVQSLKEGVAMCLGIALMILIALTE